MGFGCSSARASILSILRTFRPRARPFCRFRGFFVRVRVRSVDFADPVTITDVLWVTTHHTPPLHAVRPVGCTSRDTVMDALASAKREPDNMSEDGTYISLTAVAVVVLPDGQRKDREYRRGPESIQSSMTRGTNLQETTCGILGLNKDAQLYRGVAEAKYESGAGAHD